MSLSTSSARSVVRLAGRVASFGKRSWPVAVVLVLGFANTAVGQTAAPVVRIEEDWRVEIGTPDPDCDSPQIITVMSPTGSIDGFHVMFELNHMTQPDYFSGGMQLQCWYHDVPSCYHSYPACEKLSTPGEVITYTVDMHLHDGQLHVDIEDGQSTTWGPFGDDWRLRTCEYTSISDLKNYSPNVSVQNSRVAFASHQVARLSLVRVRYYTANGLLQTDNTERVVHQHSPN